MLEEDILEILERYEYKQMKYQPNRIHEILFEGYFKGYHFLIMNLGTHPTAYIEIPRESKLFGKDYDEIWDLTEIDVHGGPSYSDSYVMGAKENSWFIGWDYAHFGDYYGADSIFEGTGLYSKDDKKWTTAEIMQDVISGINSIDKWRQNNEL